MKFEIIAIIEAVVKLKQGLKSKEGKELTPSIVFDEHFNQLVKLIDEKKYVKVLKSKINEPVKIADEVYNSFIELSASVEGIDGLIGFIIDSGPTSVEITKPDGKASIEMDSGELEAVLNDLITKIQDYDKKLKVLTSEFIKLRQESNNGS